MAKQRGQLDAAFLVLLRSVYTAEQKQMKALRRFAKASTALELWQFFDSHYDETEEQAGRLERVFKVLGKKGKRRHCKGIAGIIESAESISREDSDPSTIDARLIAAAQRAAHYEIAAYGTLVAWATALGHHDAASSLRQTLDEEKAADERLTELADDGFNQDAAESATGSTEADAIDLKPRAPGRAGPRARRHRR